MCNITLTYRGCVNKADEPQTVISNPPSGGGPSQVGDGPGASTQWQSNGETTALVAPWRHYANTDGCLLASPAVTKPGCQHHQRSSRTAAAAAHVTENWKQDGPKYSMVASSAGAHGAITKSIWQAPPQGQPAMPG